MFKCAECGAEYKIKPDYCDCGNDMFELIEEEENDLSQDLSLNNQFYSEKDPFAQISKSNQSFFEPKSTFIFLLCIILAIVTLFFIGNPKENLNSQKIAIQEETKTEQNIPSVESYWDNSIEGVKSDNIANTTEIIVENINSHPQKTVEKKEPLDPISEKFEKWLNQPSKYTQETTKDKTTVQKTVPQQSKPATVNTTISKNTIQTKSNMPAATINTQQAKKQTQNNNSQADLIARIQKQYSNTKTQQQLPANTNTTTNTISNNNSAKTTTSHNSSTQSQSQTKTTNTSGQKVASTTTTTTNTTANQSVSTKTQNTTPQSLQIQIKPSKSQAEIKQELTTYKASLRNTIGKKINFANVVGDGNCAITFTINSSGKLTNRKFSQQSSNITLNDAVYSAMIATPSFNPPPEGYKNETLTFYVKIYDGNYEISLR